MTDTERKYFLLGQAVRRSMGAAKTPVAYLYNGVRLPKLPEWDKTAYPYAVISSEFQLTGTERVNTLYVATDLIFTHTGVTLVGGTYLIGFMNSDKTAFNEPHNKWGQADDDSTLYYSKDAVIYPLWCNTNLLYEDGSVYLAKSDPIPVYE